MTVLTSEPKMFARASLGNAQRFILDEGCQVKIQKDCPWVIVGNEPRPLQVKHVVCRISAGGVGLFLDLRWKRPSNSSQMCSMGFKSCDSEE